MKCLIGSLIGLVLSVSVGAESLLKGQVRLSSGQPAVGVQVRLFDLTDLRRFVGTTTDETGHFALPLRAFSTAKGTALPTDFALGQNYPNPFNLPTMEAEGSVYGLTVSGEGLVAHVNPTFRVGVDEVDIVVEEYGGARMKRATGGVLGDVDGNGQVDIADALFVAMYSLDSSIILPNNGDISRGDVNGDGMVDVADAVLLLRYLSNPSDPALPPGIGQDPDDTLAGATPVDLGSSTSGSLSERDIDYFRVEMSDSGTLTAYTTGGIDVKGAILDSSGTVLDDDDDGGEGRNFRVSVPVSAGTYYIRVEGWGSTTGDYTLHVVGPLDLVVAASVSDSTLAFGQPFTLRATVRNQGDGEPEPTVLFYYRSTDATITSDDTQISADVVSLETSDLVTKSLSLTAPEEAGTYYYGACVQSVSGEHNPDNNCSDAVRVTVSSEFVYTPSTPSTVSRMYWTEVGLGRIRRADLDGANVETLVTGLDNLRFLALDVNGGQMYWTEVGLGRIRRADLDGANVETLVTGLGVPIGLALDVDSGRMYWTELDSDRIRRANLDGSDVETLVTSLERPAAIALGP